ncbi:MAG: hypothetical protein LBI28_12965 [Treponema sp.]|jgi:hypothetical protein|nr:hypothetical protein [Treponema sp.]
MKKPAFRLTGTFLTLFVLFLFSSCIGLSFDIQLNRDGSGRLSLEYRVSSLINNLGELDGNESMPALPVSRADWERTVARIDGMKLVSHSSSEGRTDVETRVVLEFSNTDALIAYTGNSSNISITNNGQSGVFNFVLVDEPVDLGIGEEETEYYEKIIEMMRLFSDGYNLSISFGAVRNSTLTVTDKDGNTITPPASAVIVPSGRRVSFSMPIMDVFDLTNGLGLRFTW